MKFFCKIVEYSRVAEMMHVGRAQSGDRTMLDALIPAQQAMEKEHQMQAALKAAALAAKTGANATAQMVAKAGRAAYCKDRNKDNS